MERKGYWVFLFVFSYHTLNFSKASKAVRDSLIKTLARTDRKLRSANKTSKIKVRLHTIIYHLKTCVSERAAGLWVRLGGATFQLTLGTKLPPAIWRAGKFGSWWEFLPSIHRVPLKIFSKSWKMKFESGRERALTAVGSGPFLKRYRQNRPRSCINLRSDDSMHCTGWTKGNVDFEYPQVHFKWLLWI